MTIVYAIAVLGVLAIVFGLILAVAAKVFEVEVDPRLPEIQACLAGANCGGCGYPGCGGCAEAILAGKAPVTACAPAGAENAAAILRDCRAQADAVARDSRQRAEAQAAEHLEHLNGSSQLACRQKVLAAKQQLIDEAFAGAAQRLSSLPQAEYIDLLAALAAENGSGDEELLLSAKDREAVGPAVVKAANARKAGAAFRLSEETRETGGGLVLRRGRVELNCSFTEKLRQLRQEESSAVARLLFD